MNIASLKPSESDPTHPRSHSCEWGRTLTQSPRYENGISRLDLETIGKSKNQPSGSPVPPASRWGEPYRRMHAQERGQGLLLLAKNFEKLSRQANLQSEHEATIHI